MFARLRKLSLTHWILISMVVGALIGWAMPEVSQHLRTVSNIFLKMIKCIIVPLLFGTLVVGIASHGEDLKAVGRLAFKSIGKTWRRRLTAPSDRGGCCACRAAYYLVRDSRAHSPA
jgi:Na+/H+-dicarboxylate symporter